MRPFLSAGPSLASQSPFHQQSQDNGEISGLTHLELVVNVLSRKEAMQQLDAEATEPIPTQKSPRPSVNVSADLPTVECKKTLQNLEDARVT